MLIRSWFSFFGRRVGEIETAFVAIALVAICLHGIAFSELVVWASAGWAFLLRTPRSTARGLRWSLPFIRLGAKLFSGVTDIDVRPEEQSTPVSRPGASKNAGERLGDLVKFFFVAPFYVYYSVVVAALFAMGGFMAFVLLCLAIFLARVASTACCAIQHPIEALRAMPRAWRSAICASILISDWELMPGLRHWLRFSRADNTKIAYFATARPGEILNAAFTRMDAVSIAGVAICGLLLTVGTISFQSMRARASCDTDPLCESAYNFVSISARPVASPTTKKTTATPIQHRKYRKNDSPTIDEFNSRIERDFDLTPLRTSQDVIEEIVRFERGRMERDPNFARNKLLSMMRVQDPIFSIFSGIKYFETFLPQSWPNVIRVPTGALLFLLAISPFLTLLLLFGLASVRALRSPLRIIFFIPGIAYRVLLKVVCVMYFPLIWVVEAPFLDEHQPRAFVEGVSRDPATTIGAIFSPLGIFLYALKLLAAGFSARTESGHLNQELHRLGFNPFELHLYHIGLYDHLVVLSGILGLWFWYRATLLSDPQNMVKVSDALKLKFLGRVRSVMGAYCVIYFLILVWNLLPYLVPLDYSPGILPKIRGLGRIL